MNEKSRVKGTYYDKVYFENRDYDYESKYPAFMLMAQYLVATYHPKKTLDIGSGKGAFFVRAMREFDKDAYGIDISEYAISSAPKEIKKRLYQVDANIEDLPFENDSFELVTAFRLFEHIENLTHLTIEIRRILNKNGILFITVPTLWNIKKGKILKMLFPVFKEISPSFDRPSLNCSVLTHSKWIKHFEDQDFIYLGRLPRGLWKNIVSTPKPTTKIGYILKQSGLNFIREEIAFYFDWFTPFVFKKK